MTFNTLMNVAQEQQCLQKAAQRKEDNRMKSTTRQATRIQFPNVPEDSPLFAALHQVNVNNPERLKDLPLRARVRFGELPHVDEEGEHDYLRAPSQSTYNAIRSAVGVIRDGDLVHSRNGTQAGHTKTPNERLVARVGRPMSSVLPNIGKVPIPVADQVKQFQ